MNSQIHLPGKLLLVLFGLFSALSIAFSAGFVVDQTLTPTYDVSAMNATMFASRKKTQDAAPKTPPPESLLTATVGPTFPPQYPSNCLPRIAGDGLLFGSCAVTNLPALPPGLRKYGATNLWRRPGADGNLDVIGGYGGISVYKPGKSPYSESDGEYYPISNGATVEIVDAQGSVLIFRSLFLTPSQQLYFDVGARQFVPSLLTSTPTPTSTFTSTSTRTPTFTSTSIPTRTLPPTPKPSQYPVTIQGLRAMLRDLHDRNQVEDGIYRALDVILISAARQVAHDNELIAIVELRAFIKIVEAQSGKQIKPEAAEQLTTQAHKVMQRLWEEVDRYRDDD